MSVKERWEEHCSALLRCGWLHQARDSAEKSDPFLATQTAARDLALAPLLEVRKGLEELQRLTLTRPKNFKRYLVDNALQLVNDQIEAVEKLGRES